MELEKIALEDDYFVSRKLYPNVDFYSGLIYEAFQFPPEMFTVLFAIGRTPGWLAQWLELVQDKEQKIARPQADLHRPADPRLRARLRALELSRSGSGEQVSVSTTWSEGPRHRHRGLSPRDAAACSTSSSDWEWRSASNAARPPRKPKSRLVHRM